MSRNSKALGDAGLHVIRTAAEGCAQIDRQLLRNRILEMTRPSPGTSELLSRPMMQEVTGWGGKDVVMYDVVMGLAPIHLKGGRVEKEVKEETLRRKLEKEGL